MSSFTPPLDLQRKPNLTLGSNTCEGKQLEDPKRVSNDEYVHDENVEIVDKEVSSPSNDESDDDMHDSNEVTKDPKQTFLKPFTLPFPFPQRMAMTKLDLQFVKFLEVLKKLYIDISFIDAMS